MVMFPFEVIFEETYFKSAVIFNHSLVALKKGAPQGFSIMLLVENNFKNIESDKLLEKISIMISDIVLDQGSRY